MEDIRLVKKITATDNRKFIGVKVEPDTDLYLSLFAVSRNISLSEFLRKQLEIDVHTYKEKISETDLIEKIIRHVQIGWDTQKWRYKNHMQDTEFENYCMEISKYYKKRHITKDIISIIITNLKK